MPRQFKREDSSSQELDNTPVKRKGSAQNDSTKKKAKPGTDPSKPVKVKKKVVGKEPAEVEPQFVQPLICGSWLPKGGVGKTSTVLGLAGKLAANGKVVIVADADMQCSLTDACTDIFEDDSEAQKLLERKREIAKQRFERVFASEPDDVVEEDVSEAEEGGPEVEHAGNEEGQAGGAAKTETGELVAAGPKADNNQTEAEEGEEGEDEEEGEEDGKAEHVKPFPLPAINGDSLPGDVTMYYGPSQTQARQRLLDSTDDKIKTIFTAVQEFNKAGPGTHLRLPHLFDIPLDGGYEEHTVKGKILLLAGDPKLAGLKFDKESVQPDYYQRQLFGLRYVLRRLAEAHRADLILIDMGPASSMMSKYLLHTADAVIPSFKPDYYGWASYTHLALDVLPDLRYWLRSCSVTLTEKPEDDIDWAADLYRGQRGDRNHRLPLPYFLPGLGTQYELRNETADERESRKAAKDEEKQKRVAEVPANFLKSIQEFLHPYYEADSFALEEQDRKQFLVDADGQAVLAFLPLLKLFDISHELGLPVTLIHQDMIRDMFKRLGLRSKSLQTEIDLVQKRWLC